MVVAAVAEWYRYRTVACLVTSSSPVPLKTRSVESLKTNLWRLDALSFEWCGSLPSGQGNDSWPACREFERSTSEDPPCRGAMHVKSVESSNVLSLVWYLGEEVLAQVSSSSLDHGSKLQGSPPKDLV
ncbi:hypothetical protein TNCV_3322911 [Trichonephila clavipes]|nr:hypothetical protein TNCV_3322911 [Trichonephila clavipes]